MDAIAIDVSRFHIIVERFGAKFADLVLISLAHRIRDVINKLGGIVCRKEEDTFLVYTPHIKDLRKVLDDILDNLFVGELSKAKARLKMGVYQNVNKNLPIETRFDRALFALNKINNNLVDNISIYDSKLHEKEMFEEQLIDDFKQAIENKEFVVYYQPKFFIQKDTPELTSAEALVRWNHKKLGIIPPSIFIPLFEENGLIQELDNYVWNETANQIRIWKDKYNKSIKVSVNVSRIDIYDPNLLEKFKNIIKENKLSFDELILEITESAYTSDVDIIINRINELKDLGFIIEMDDFGTGYSSLNMISNLPLDALKLDMLFIKEAFTDKKDTKIIELIINLAKKLSLKVVAEGVETLEQLDALKELGCDIVQGYYYSKPIPAIDFEKFIGDKK
jgi:EAL domain-containing protein (putative c-di-GMP-specific phosphodiesterase class I)